MGSLLALSLLAAACGDDDDGDDAAADESAAGGTTTTTAPDYELEEPLRIVAVISEPGGSDPNAVPDYVDGIEMAIAEINEAGGLGGHPIEFEAVETPAVGDEITNSLNLALEEDPDVLLGPVSSTAVLAMAERVDAAGVPMIHNTTEPKVAGDGEAGSPWIFGNRPPNDGAARIAARYAVEELGAEEIGQLYVNTAFGQSGNEAQDAEIEELGAEVAAERSFEFNATDLTEAVLAMEDVDVVLDWGTPATVGLAVNTLAQQGLADVPHIGPGSVGFSFFADIVGDESLLEGVLGVVDCNPADDDREGVEAWHDAFVEEYGYEPSYGAAQMYDAVHIVAAIVNEAQAADPETIRQGLESLDGHEGICAIYSNENNVLQHSSVVVRFEDGSLVTEKTYDDVG
nr:amino acid ABC transporter substrate-binding protein [Thermoanaerobacterales bacterium]